MRVAYIGNFEPEWSTENDVRLALEELGHDVVTLQENRAKWQAVREVALQSDLLLWTGTWDPVEGPNYSPSAQPFLESLETLTMCARKGIPTATYHLDTFWSTARGGRRWWMHPMFHTRHVFTADGDHDEQWQQLGTNHIWLPPGVRHSATEPGTACNEFMCDVAFVGSDGHGYHDEWPYRRILVDELEAMCRKNGWSFKNPGGREPKVDRGRMNDFYASAKVTVGDSLCPYLEDSRYWSDRAYEAPGRGGFLIMPRINALSEDYHGDLPDYPWEDFGSLERTIRFFLENPGTRLGVQATCWEIAGLEHTYVNRMTTLLETIG